MENNFNSRLIILENRILKMEKENKRLSANMHILNSNDDLFLEITKTMTSAIECNQRVDDIIHEAALNRIKGINMHMGKIRKSIEKLKK